jgi:hypothetical protein
MCGQARCLDDGAMRRMFKFSVKIWQTQQLTPTVSASSWTVRRRSSWMSSGIFSTFSVVLHALGRPERLSSSTDIQLALKRECNSKTTIRLKECSPQASQSTSRVSVVNLPSFMQNLMLTRCSILPSIADKMKYEVEKALL